MSSQDSLPDEKRPSELKSTAPAEKDNELALFWQAHEPGPSTPADSKRLCPGETKAAGLLSAEIKTLDATGEKAPGELEPERELKGTDSNQCQDESACSGAEKLLKSAADAAYDSYPAAYLTVANTLSDDARLRSMVTDSSGMITRESVDNVLRADADAVMEAGQSKIALPQELTTRQRQSLELVRSHIDQITAASRQLIAAAPEREGISAESVELLSSKSIQKLLADSRIKPSEIDRNVLERIVLNARLAEEAGKAEGKSFTPRVIAGDGAPDQTHPDADRTEGRLSSGHEKPTDRIDVPQITDAEFSSFAKKVLTQLDSDHRAHISKEQLAKALEDPSFTGQPAQVLAAMYKNFDRLQNLSKHERYFDLKSITAGDLDRFNELQAVQSKRVTDAFDMKSWAHQNLSRFDQDKSGSITRSEIESALQDPRVSQKDKTMLGTIKRHYSEMGHLWESGVNLKGFDDYAANINKDTDTAKLVAGVFHTCYNVNKGQKPQMSHDLYADKTSPLKSITPDAIRQGSIGDCYFVSSLAAVAEAHPEMIKNAIKDNGDGTCTVIFPGAKDEAITIKTPTQAEQGLYNHASPEGLWASVMEKAYGKYRENHAWAGSATPEEGADGGGMPARAMKLLTGSRIDTDMTAFASQATIAGKLETAFSAHPQKSVTAGINGSLFSEQTADKFYKGHAYTITGFVPGGTGGGMITIRNPWGGKDGTTDGTITITLDKFIKNFSQVSYEK